jgi:hypothetical protein
MVSFARFSLTTTQSLHLVHEPTHFHAENCVID